MQWSPWQGVEASTEVKRSRSGTMMQFNETHGHRKAEPCAMVFQGGTTCAQGRGSVLERWEYQARGSDYTTESSTPLAQITGWTCTNNTSSAWSTVEAQQRSLPNIAGHKALSMHLCKDERGEAWACQSLPWICSVIPHKLLKANICFKQKYKRLFSFLTVH